MKSPFKTGTWLGVSLIAFTSIFAAVLWYMQSWHFYEPVTDVSFIKVQDKDIPVTHYKGVDNSHRPLKMRACFRVEDILSLRKLAPKISEIDPFKAPAMLDCWNTNEIEQGLNKGNAIAFLAEELEQGIYDRILVVFDDGRAFMWRQLNKKYRK